MRKEAVYYRKTDKKNFKDFGEGDIICEVCNGWGYFYDCYDNKVSQCYHCKGDGKLDWITNVTGVAQSANNGGYSTSFDGSSGVVPSRKAVKDYIDNKASMKNAPQIRTIPYKKLSLKQKVMNMVAGK